MVNDASSRLKAWNEAKAREWGSERQFVHSIEMAARAMPGPREMMHKAMGAVVAQPEWWILGAARAVSIAIAETNGAINPSRVVDEYNLLLEERGLAS